MHDNDGAITPACQRSNSRQFQYTVQAVVPPAAPAVVDFPPFTTAREEQIFAASAQATCGQGGPWAYCRGLVAWWFVELHALEVTRINPAPGSPIAPLTKQQIRATGRRCTLLKAKFALADFTEFAAERIVDVGNGQSFTWYGPSIAATVLGPASLTPSEVSAPQGELVSDVLVEVSAAAVPWSTGKTGRGSLTYTDSFVPGGPAVVVVRPIPPGARSMQLFQTGGTAVVATYLGPGGALIGPSGGFVFAVPINVPTNACDVQITTPAGFPATAGVSYVYGLDV